MIANFHLLVFKQTELLQLTFHLQHNTQSLVLLYPSPSLHYFLHYVANCLFISNSPKTQSSYLRAALLPLTCHFLLLSFISTFSCHTNTLNCFIFCWASAFNLQALKAIFGKSFQTVKPEKKINTIFTQRNCSY